MGINQKKIEYVDSVLGEQARLRGWFLSSEIKSIPHTWIKHPGYFAQRYAAFLGFKTFKVTVISSHFGVIIYARNFGAACDAMASFIKEVKEK